MKKQVLGFLLNALILVTLFTVTPANASYFDWEIEESEETLPSYLDLTVLVKFAHKGTAYNLTVTGTPSYSAHVSVKKTLTTLLADESVNEKVDITTQVLYEQDEDLSGNTNLMVDFKFDGTSQEKYNFHIYTLTTNFTQFLWNWAADQVSIEGYWIGTENITSISITNAYIRWYYPYTESRVTRYKWYLIKKPQIKKMTYIVGTDAYHVKLRDTSNDKYAEVNIRSFVVSNNGSKAIKIKTATALNFQRPTFYVYSFTTLLVLLFGGLILLFFMIKIKRRRSSKGGIFKR